MFDFDTAVRAYESANRLIGEGTYNIGFTSPDGADDETQFDLEAGETAADLKTLWQSFCKENGFWEEAVNYIEDGQED